MHYSHISVVLSFRFLQLVIAHPAFSKDEDLQKFLKEENVSYDFESNHCWFWVLLQWLFILHLIVPKKRYDKNINIYYNLLTELSKDRNFLHLQDGFCEVAVCKENSVR